MKFRVEQIFLTDQEGRVVEAGKEIDFHIVDADDPRGAILQFLAQDEADLMGEVLKFPGMQAVATARRGNLVYTLQLIPATDRIQIR